MRCPRDQNKLSRKISERVFGDCCNDCGGIFLSGKGVKSFKHNFDTQILENKANENPKGDSDLMCPHCDVSMNIVIVDNIEIEICSDCSGVWFDKTEAKQIIDKYGGISEEENIVASIMPFPFDLVYFLSKWFTKDKNSKKQK